MKAVVYYEFGGLDVLQYKDLPEPEIAEKEVLVRVQSCAINHLDLLQREGPGRLPFFSLPHIAGMDVAGDIEQVGSEAAGLRVGDRVVLNPSMNCGQCSLCIAGEDNHCPELRVIGASLPGGYAEYVKAPVSHVHSMPSGMPYDEVACVPTVGVTAWHGLITRGKLLAGETVLIHAAGSGVGSTAIGVAKLCGARVIATAGSDEKLEFARRLGADVLVNYNTQDFTEIAKEETDGDGVDMVFDHVGPATWEKSILALRRRGRMVYCGTTTGSHAQINLPYSYHKGITLIGSDGYTKREFEHVLRLVASGAFGMNIDSIYPLAEAAEAQRKMMERRLCGKVLLHP